MVHIMGMKGKKCPIQFNLTSIIVWPVFTCISVGRAERREHCWHQLADCNF